MDVQFSTGLLSFPNGNVPLVAREVGQERCSVILAHDVRFDNNTREVNALGRLSRPGESVSKLSSCALFSPKGLEHDVGILMAHAVVDASSGNIPIRMLATTPHASLRKGKVIGYVEEEVDMVAFCNVRTKSKQNPLEHDLSSCRGRGVAGQRPRVVCERFLENKVHAAQSAAGREAPLRPAGGLGGRCKRPSGVWGSAPENFESPQNWTHKKQYFSDIY